jgi:PAS domain S-box-containing protein
MMSSDQETSTPRRERGIEALWSVFAQSRIPMALVDENRRYVKVNNAAVELFQYERDEAIGARAARTARDADPLTIDAQWEQLRRGAEVYGERVVEHHSGSPIRVSFAAHAMVIEGQWMALLVALSAHHEPDGIELIHAGEGDRSNGPGEVLTRREREIVHFLALGRNSRQIATELYLSPATINSHIRNAMLKVDARTRAQLVAITLGHGLNDS